jgi:hypothetical protein
MIQLIPILKEIFAILAKILGNLVTYLLYALHKGMRFRSRYFCWSRFIGVVDFLNAFITRDLEVIRLVASIFFFDLAMACLDLIKSIFELEKAFIFNGNFQGRNFQLNYQ